MLKPGDVITITNLNELPAFEDAVANYISPFHHPGIWAGREPLANLIRPHGFNGRIADITLTVMADPYERLLDATKRGLTLGKNTPPPIVKEESKRLIPLFQGFRLLADARTSGRGVVGQVQGEIWYYPLIPQVRKHGAPIRGKYTDASGVEREYTNIVGAKTGKDQVTQPNIDSKGKTLNRLVAVPKLEKSKDRFIQLKRESRHIAMAVLRRELQRPISTPMQD